MNGSCLTKQRNRKSGKEGWWWLLWQHASHNQATYLDLEEGLEFNNRSQLVENKMTPPVLLSF